MPLVRRPDRTQTIGALPGVRATAASTAQSEGANLEIARGRAEASKFGGDIIREQAKGDTFGMVSRVGADLFAKFSAEERDKSNQAALAKASNALSDWKNKKLYDPNDGVLNRRGESALGAPEEVNDEFSAVADEVAGGLSNDDQRQAFERLRSQEHQSLDLQVRRHTFEQVNEYRAGEMKGVITNATDEAIRSSSDPKLVNVALSKAVGAVRTAGKMMGQGDELIKDNVRAVTSQIHTGVIGQLLADENDAGATAYFEATRDQIEADKLDGITKAIETGQIRGQSQKQSDEIIRAGGTLNQQLEKAKTLDPKLRDEVTARLEHNAAIEERAKREADETALTQAYNLVDQAKSTDAIPPAQWASLDGSARASLIHYARLKAAGEPVRTDDPTYYALMQQAGEDPSVFTKQNLLNYRGKLDDGDFKQLTSLQLSIRNGNRSASEKDLAGYRTKSELVDDSLTQYGIDPRAKPASAEGKAIANLRRLLDQRVEVVQSEGKKVTNVEVQQALDDILGTQVTTPGSWWNIFPGGKPFFDQKRRAVDLSIDDVPTEKRQKIEERLRRRGMPVTDQSVLDWYIDVTVQTGGK